MPIPSPIMPTIPTRAPTRRSPGAMPGTRKSSARRRRPHCSKRIPTSAAIYEELQKEVLAKGPYVIIFQQTEVAGRSEEHTSELQSLMRISYAVFCLKKKKHHNDILTHNN